MDKKQEQHQVFQNFKDLTLLSQTQIPILLDVEFQTSLEKKALTKDLSKAHPEANQVSLSFLSNVNQLKFIFSHLGHWQKLGMLILDIEADILDNRQKKKVICSNLGPLDNWAAESF